MTTNNNLTDHDARFREFLLLEGYLDARKLPDGEWAVLVRLAFTTAVALGADYTAAYKYRWCFEDASEARYFFDTVQEFDEIPKRRVSLKGHRYLDNPLLVQKDELGFDKW